MANVAKYDRDDVIRKAMLLFWEKGFHATSTRDLQQAVDLRPGSIYSAFGSKEGLFKEALKHYAANTYALLQEKIQQQGSPLAGLQAFIHCVVITNRSSAPSDMCMLAKTVAELTDSSPELLHQSQALMKQGELSFARVLQEAQALGELPASADPEALAKYIQVQVIGLRTYLRTSDDVVAVEKLIEDTFHMLKTPH
ncbi:TetR/AcrR family transcriptional regulator [Neptunomonas qingdaonensis]|uniref:Transcriptional regulator, TetR family n=1 Tax=Neptunomonas qingdaonensis TaxID=1045558 RepID=A0A1I2U8A0_9GAMM|nr:TetR/AcrR family transcriptional regulator [Neptunomonas qingdaonensis]SFG73405.1 transcriptional regulator, TetR family [Neptunomonas qingdaonensis]